MGAFTKCTLILLSNAATHNLVEKSGCQKGKLEAALAAVIGSALALASAVGLLGLAQSARVKVGLGAWGVWGQLSLPTLPGMFLPWYPTLACLSFIS